MNAFETHEELYWNVNGGEWSVPTLATSATVRLAGGGLERAACFEGYARITDPCTVRTAGGQPIPQQSTQPSAAGVPLPADTAELTYTATAPFEPREQLTIVAAIRKGAIQQPAVILEKKPRHPTRFFETRNPITVGGTALLAAASLGLLVANWWKGGRDRRYTTIHYLTENPEEETRPLFQSHPVVVEFEPPEGIKPAQAGLLIDEKADTLDVTATIVDLAVRGYLTIEEIPKKWLLGSKDWRLTRRRADTDGLEAYERIILDGLFDDGDDVTLSSLKNEYYKDLQRAQKALYSQATERRWFNGNPETRRTLWGVGAVVLIVAGVGLTVALGYFFGAGLLGLPVALLGIALLISSRSMAQRTAQGSELLRRVLGFRRYIVTAEKNQQQFNERANIFAEYLPYAIVFGVVDRWASAFREIDTTAAVAAWYVGSGGFNAPRFSRDLQSFSSTVSSAIASTPGGSGGSGFSGGGAGGGGGGGGGGSW